MLTPISCSSMRYSLWAMKHSSTKCSIRLQQMQQNGTALLIVSHALSLLATLCNRVIWLDQGRVMAEGHPIEVLQQYSPSVVFPNAGEPV